jgi:hypothetical protein
MQFAASMAGSLTKEQRDSMTPSQVIDELKKGNERFRTGKMAPRYYLAEKRSSAAGQYPAAVSLDASIHEYLRKSFSTLGSATRLMGASQATWSMMTCSAAWSLHVLFREQSWF